MEQKNGIRMAVIVLAAAFCIIGVIVAVFLYHSSTKSAAEIVLPTTLPTESEADSEGTVPFLSVSPDNVAAVIQTLQRPEIYRQTLRVTTQWDTASAVSTVSAWYDRGLARLDITRQNETVHYLVGGRAIYLWYNTDSQYLHIDSSAISKDDLAMIPTYEDVQLLDPAAITDAHYETGDDGAYLTVLCADGDYQDQDWIDLDSGLLTQAETTYQGKTIYTMQQTTVEILTQDQVDLAEHFRLPDQSDPFHVLEE